MRGEILEILKALVPRGIAPDGMPRDTAVDGNGRFVVNGDLYVSPRITIPGITAADALDAGDAIGTIFAVPAPRYGILTGAGLIDPDDDTLALTAHAFRKPFTATASDAALNIAAVDALNWIISISFVSAMTDIGAAKVGRVDGINAPFYAPDNKLYFQCSTAGTPNIAAGLMPLFWIMCLPLEPLPGLP